MKVWRIWKYIIKFDCIEMSTSETAYNELEIGYTNMLVHRHSFFFVQALQHSLAQPNHIRENWLAVNDIHKHTSTVKYLYGVYVSSDKFTTIFNIRDMIS